MPVKLERANIEDTDPHDDEDATLLAHLKPIAMKFKPSPQSRLDRLDLMPPPTSSSVTASKTLAREIKSIVKLQSTNQLPFYLDPETEK
jgi:hypothetical protein